MTTFKRSGRALAASLALTAVLASTALAASPPKATGGAHVVAGAVGFDVTFNAQLGKDGAKGQFRYSSDTGAWFTGDVTCYVQAGNVASFSGTVREGTFSNPYFEVWVRDGGEGENSATPDAIRVFFPATSSGCGIGAIFPGTVVRGNLQVHQ